MNDELPALSLAEQMQKWGARVGFTFPSVEGAWDKLDEEIAEFRAEPSEDELGDILMACVSVARHHGLDPERALHATCRKYRQRLEALERVFGPDMTGHTLEELTAAWEAAKRKGVAGS